MHRLLWLVAVSLTPIGLVGLARAQVGTPPGAEPPPPMPSLGIQQMAASYNQAVAGNKPLEELLKLADKQLAATRAEKAATAQQKAAGEAWAQQARGMILQSLARREAAITAWRATADAWRRAAYAPGQIQALAGAASLLFADRPTEARQVLSQALALARREPKWPLTASYQLTLVAPYLAGLGLAKEAEEFGKTGLALAEKAGPGSLSVATAHSALGQVALMREDLPAASTHYRQALELGGKLAPNSPVLLPILTGSLEVAIGRGDVETAERHALEATRIARTTVPGTYVDAMVRIAEAELSAHKGDYEAALKLVGEAEAILLNLRVFPNSVANLRGSLLKAYITKERGDLVSAQETLQLCVFAAQGQAECVTMLPGARRLLADITADLGQFDEAKAEYQKALEAQMRLRPRSPQVARIHAGLALATYQKGDAADADKHLSRALEALVRIDPSTPTLTLFLARERVGTVALKMENAEAAFSCLDVAASDLEKAGADATLRARARRWVAQAERRRGRQAAAIVHLERAEEMASDNSLLKALIQVDLGLAHLAQNERASAESALSEGWEGILSEIQSTSGDQVRQLLVARHQPIAAALVRVRVELGQIEKAFETFEDGRALALRELMLERAPGIFLGGAAEFALYRGVLVERDRAEETVSQAVLEETAARRRLDASQQRGAPAAEIARLQMEQKAAAGRTAQAQAAFREVVAKVSGHERELKGLGFSLFNLSRFRFGQPGKQVLTGGAVLASFAVGEESSYLFLATEDKDGDLDLHAYPLSVGEKQVRSLVQGLRRQLAGDGDRAARLATTRQFADGVPEKLVQDSRDLFRRLFPGEAEKAVRNAPRLVLCPDGPLWELPFAALVMDAGDTPRYLGREKPLVYAPSLEVHRQLRQALRHEKPPAKLMALVVGNPTFDPVRPTPNRPRLVVRDPLQTPTELRLLFDPGETPPPLPGSRAEAEAVAGLYESQALLGDAPTEEVVQKRLSSADLVHLATHGYFNPYRAMSSGVLLAVPPIRSVLSPVSFKDGALQAWEILNQVKLRAELVVLSACETGRGENLRGEGIVGLTRALQVAGARSVVASQWQVADASTAKLMVAFHTQLREGLDKDEALRRSMAELAKDPRTAHPYFWAAFFLTGDTDNGILKR